MTKLFVEPNQVLENTIIITDKDDIHHMSKVLRVSEGEEIQVSDKCAWEYSCRIILVEKDRIEAEILDKQKFAKEPELQVTIFQAIPKSDKMETVIQKSVELGAYSIVPVWTERTITVDKGNFGKKRERWQKISQEAVKQCKRGIIPEIGPNLKFNEMLNELKNYQLVLFPYENEENYSIKDCLSAISEKPKNAAIIIGPEGGFSQKEARLIEEAGGKTVTLGKTILRTETAGPAALAMVMYALEL